MKSPRAHGVQKLLSEINVNKALGLDSIPNAILKSLSNELAPVLASIFNQTLVTGQLPDDWRNANISPIFKKGDKHQAANYRPVSLTCVCTKLMEHILVKHILTHLEKHQVLTTLQHGFRSGFSCETQLLNTVDDLADAFNRNVQTDIGILDFSKAFDVVPHKKLLKKLSHYGIQGDILQWISEFLTNRKQRVVVDGHPSSSVRVASGVPQGTCLGPLLFLCYINDITHSISSKMRLFADDCLIYRDITCTEDQIELQRDLTTLENWATKWGMKFNPTKCYILSVSRSTSTSTNTWQTPKLDNRATV